MAKYMGLLRYSQSGLQGTIKEGFRNREGYVRQLVESIGGKVEALYWMHGEDDFVLIFDADSAAAVASSLAVNSSGIGEFRTMPLLTAAEMDAGVAKMPQYRPPG